MPVPADGSSTVAKIAADLRLSADGSAVRTSLVAGGGYAAGSQRARSLGSCAMGQTDGRIATEALSHSIEVIGATEISLSIYLSIYLSIS